MVKAHMKHTPSPEQEDSPKKKAASKKKAAEPGSWPCKINGCDKVFAREADLKRHQRTTKTHTMPGFACVQCDATFTRTDALRRHQKSRHNGVVLEPRGSTKGAQDTNGEASGSRSSSRSASPSGSNADAEDAPKSPQTPATQPEQPPAGPSSYYRPHTMHSSPYPPRPVSMDAHYPPHIGLPTSAARLGHPPWQPGAVWPDGAGPPHPIYAPPYYQPSPYYRHPMYPMAPGYPPVPPEYMGQPYPYAVPPPGTAIAYPPPPGILQPPLSAIPRGGSAGNDENADNGETQRSGSEPKEPPPKRRKQSHESPVTAEHPSASPENSSNSPHYTTKPTHSAPAALDATLMLAPDEAATVVALLQQASGHPFPSNPFPIASPSQPPPIPASSSQSVPPQTVAPADTTVTPNTTSTLDYLDSDADADGEVDAEGEDADADGEADEEAEFIPVSDVQPQALPAQMLTEDGEPMLNPAELLTQESLASPPVA